jgi:hypothetical protein
MLAARQRAKNKRNSVKRCNMIAIATFEKRVRFMASSPTKTSDLRGNGRSRLSRITWSIKAGVLTYCGCFLRAFGPETKITLDRVGASFRTSPNACAGPQTDTELFSAAAGPVRNKAELKKFLMSS